MEGSSGSQVADRQEPPATGSLAWLHFTKKENGATCNYSKKFIPINGCNTSGMIRHLPSHKEPYGEYLKQKKIRSTQMLRRRKENQVQMKAGH